MLVHRWALSLVIFLATFVASAADYTRNISLEWEPLEGATSYDVEIKKSEKIKINHSLNAEWTGPLAPGDYTLRVRGRDKRKVPGVWSEIMKFHVGLETVKLLLPKNQAQILAKEEDEATVLLRWKPLPLAVAYRLQVQSRDGKFNFTKELPDSEYEIKLPVASPYTWKVIAITDNGLTSDAAATDEFTLIGPKLARPRITEPANGYVRDLEWTRPLYSEYFDYAITRWNPQTKKWELQDKKINAHDSKIPFSEQSPGGQYRIAVRAKAPFREDSRITELKFHAIDGNRSPAAEERATIRESIDRTTGWFVIASYLITQMQYSGTNFDNSYGEQLNVSLSGSLGGTGRLGLGYLSDRTNWGFLGILDYSGFVINNTAVTFASVEANAIYRTNAGDRGEIRQQIGGFYKELPILVAQNSAVVNSSKVSAIGPHYGFEYWHALTAKMGFQANMHGYYSLISLSTPNGNKASPDLSYQLGLLGSYRFSRKGTGLMGYAYRRDSISYLSNAGPVNSATITGHYLNFFLEWAL